MQPPGGHAIYLDAKLFLPHIPIKEYPGQALACELYLAGGRRSSEIGSFMFGKMHEYNNTEIYADQELVRLAIPRRTYTQSHIDYVIEIIENVFKNRKTISGLKIVKQNKYLRHFTASLERI